MTLPAPAAVPLVVFMVSTPEDFLEFTKAREPDPASGEPDPQKVLDFIAAHPETGNALQLGIPKIAPTKSFATSGYNGLHAFALVDADGNETWGRYRWQPVEGEHYLNEEEVDEADRDYLQAEIRERLESGDARFRLDFVLAQDGDSLTDPTEEWKGDREVVTLGELTVTDVIDEPTDGPLVFDPTNDTDGWKLSDDRILAARSSARAAFLFAISSLSRALRSPAKARFSLSLICTFASESCSFFLASTSDVVVEPMRTIPIAAAIVPASALLRRIHFLTCASAPCS